MSPLKVNTEIELISGDHAIIIEILEDNLFQIQKHGNDHFTCIHLDEIKDVV